MLIHNGTLTFSSFASSGNCEICDIAVRNNGQVINRGDIENDVVINYSTEDIYKAISGVMDSVDGVSTFVMFPCSAIAFGIRTDNIAAVFNDNGPAHIRCDVYVGSFTHKSQKKDELLHIWRPYCDYAATIEMIDAKTEQDFEQLTGLVLAFIGALIPNYVITMQDPRGILDRQPRKAGIRVTMLHKCKLISDYMDNFYILRKRIGIEKVIVCNGTSSQSFQTIRICWKCVKILKKFGMPEKVMDIY